MHPCNYFLLSELCCVDENNHMMKSYCNSRLVLNVYRLEVNKGIAIETIHYLNDGLWHMKPMKWCNRGTLHLTSGGLTQNAIATSGCVALSHVHNVWFTQLPCFHWDGKRFDIYLKLFRKCWAGPSAIEDRFCYWPEHAWDWLTYCVYPAVYLSSDSVIAFYALLHQWKYSRFTCSALCSVRNGLPLDALQQQLVCANNWLTFTRRWCNVT